MGYVFDFQDAGSYDAGFDQAKDKYRLNLGIKFMMGFISPRENQRILDIGCGTGLSLEPLLDKGLNLTGLDPSPYMLDIAAKRLDHSVDLHRGLAEDLPFDDNEFDTALLFNSLEFTQRPAKAIEEACRVAKDSVVLCVLNRYAPLNMARRLKGFFIPSIYNHAHFFSILELRQILHAVLGKVPIQWRTTLQFPFAHGSIPGWVENIGIVQKSYFGTLIGMKIKPVPKFRTRPLVLKIKNTKAYKPATGWTRIGL